MGFDKLFWNRFDELNKDTNLAYTFGCDAYKAGAASRQEEVNKLQVEIDVLQKRIDEALRLVQKDCEEYGITDYLEKAIKILKGGVK